MKRKLGSKKQKVPDVAIKKKGMIPVKKIYSNIEEVKVKDLRKYQMLKIKNCCELELTIESLILDFEQIA